MFADRGNKVAVTGSRLKAGFTLLGGKLRTARGREKRRETAIGCKIIVRHTKYTMDVEALAEKLKVDE